MRIECVRLAGELESNLSTLQDVTAGLMVSFEEMRQKERCMTAELVRVEAESVPCRVDLREGREGFRKKGACGGVRGKTSRPGRLEMRSLCHAHLHSSFLRILQEEARQKLLGIHEKETKLSDAEARVRELEANLRKSESLAANLRTQAEEAQQREAAIKVLSIRLR